jgi:hypothetical protein
MDIEGKTIWQVAAGNGDNTHYAKLCLQQNVILIGPGNCGPWPDCERPLREDNVSARRVGIVRRFAEDMRVGDLVVLRVGTQQVYGVGEIIGNYDWNADFKNVQGWDLQHFRRMKWLWHQDGKPKTFPVYSLNLGNSVQKLTSPTMHHWLQSLSIP